MTFTDLFWKQLDNVVSVGTKFIFNLVSTLSTLIEWSESDSFLKNFTVLTILIQFKKPCSTMKFIQEDESDEISSCEGLEEEIQKKINEKIKWNKNSKSKVENN